MTYPLLNGPETPAHASSSNGNDADSLGGIVLSQLTASNWPPDAIIDGIRITKSWQDLPLALGSAESIPLASYSLAQNYPNPFNPSTTIHYELPMTGYVDLSIYNVIGQKIATLVSERQAAGVYKIEWHARGFASGIYYYRLQTGKYFDTKKLVLLQ